MMMRSRHRSRYPWLKARQNEARDERSMQIDNMRNKLLDLNGAPLSMRYGMRPPEEVMNPPTPPTSQFYTGAGENGRIEPNKPTHMMNTNNGPRMVHEGERVDINSQGLFNVTPASQMGGQGNLQQMEQRGSVPGYQSGILQYTNPPSYQQYRNTQQPLTFNQSQLASGPSFGSPTVSIPQPMTFGGSTEQPATISDVLGRGTPTTKTPGDMYTDVANNASQLTAPAPESRTQMELPTATTAVGPTAELPTTTATGPTAALPGETQSPEAIKSSIRNLLGQTGAPITDQLVDYVASDPKRRDWLADGKYVVSPEGKIYFPEDLEYRQMRPEEFPGAIPQQPGQIGVPSGTPTTGATQTGGGPAGVPLDQAPAVTPEPTPTPSQFERAASSGLAGLQRTAAGISQFDERQRQQIRDMYGGQEQAALASIAQTASQLGLTGRESMIAGVMAQRRIGAEEAGAIAKQMADEAGRVQQAQQDLVQYGQAGMQIENNIRLANEQWADTQQWQNFQRAAEYGDDATLAGAYQELFGQPITDMAMVNDIRNYARTLRQQDLTTNDLNIKSLENQVGTEVMDSVRSMVAANMPRDVVNNFFRGQTGRDMTDAEYQQMQDATPFGELKWDRQMNAANMLMATNDPENITYAASLYENMFPGVTFDFSQVASDVGAERFATAMTDMGTLASTFDNWDEASKSVEGLKLLKDLNMTPDQGESLFNSMKVNALDEEWSVWESSDLYKSLLENDPDQADLIQQLFIKTHSGEAEFDLVDEWVVKTKDGSTVKRFSDKPSADEFMSNNTGKEYTLASDQRIVGKDLITGDSVTVNVNGSNEINPTNPEYDPVGSNYDQTITSLNSGPGETDSQKMTFNNTITKTVDSLKDEPSYIGSFLSSSEVNDSAKSAIVDEIVKRIKTTPEDYTSLVLNDKSGAIYTKLKEEATTFKSGEKYTNPKGFGNAYDELENFTGKGDVFIDEYGNVCVWTSDRINIDRIGTDASVYMYRVIGDPEEKDYGMMAGDKNVFANALSVQNFMTAGLAGGINAIKQKKARPDELTSKIKTIWEQD